MDTDEFLDKVTETVTNLNIVTDIVTDKVTDTVTDTYIVTNTVTDTGKVTDFSHLQRTRHDAHFLRGYSPCDVMSLAMNGVIEILE
jgi:hypothetical protein